MRYDWEWFTLCLLARICAFTTLWLLIDPQYNEVERAVIPVWGFAMLVWLYLDEKRDMDVWWR